MPKEDVSSPDNYLRTIKAPLKIVYAESGVSLDNSIITLYWPTTRGIVRKENLVLSTLLDKKENVYINIWQSLYDIATDSRINVPLIGFDITFNAPVNIIQEISCINRIAAYETAPSSIQERIFKHNLYIDNELVQEVSSTNLDGYIDFSNYPYYGEEIKIYGVDKENNILTRGDVEVKDFISGTNDLTPMSLEEDDEDSTLKTRDFLDEITKESNTIEYDNEIEE